MSFLLSSKNVFEYLIEKGLCTSSDQAEGKFELKPAKNFNLRLDLPSTRQLLVKQEPCDREGKTAGEFAHEWQIQEFLRQFPELNAMRDWISQAIHFDAKNSIIVFNYLSHYRDLMDFYVKENQFPVEIAASVGATIAKIHCLTFEHQNYQDFFVQKWENEAAQKPVHLIGRVGRIGPEIFGLVPSDGLKFFALYQRYDSLGKAIADLLDSYAPACLTHNDLKLNNILLPLDWEQTLPQAEPNEHGLRLIDWERSTWGDPAFDLGMVIASYLQIWLGSLVTSKTISINESLSMATTPLERLQPSIAALTIAYLEQFPEIVEHRPMFLQRVVQFVGLALIQSIHATLQYQKSFGNVGVCMLQVAKSLLCRPADSIETVFGMEADDLVPFNAEIKAGTTS